MAIFCAHDGNPQSSVSLASGNPYAARARAFEKARQNKKWVRCVAFEKATQNNRFNSL
jgi:hypothetical protein